MHAWASIKYSQNKYTAWVVPLENAKKKRNRVWGQTIIMHVWASIKYSQNKYTAWVVPVYEVSRDNLPH